MLNFITMERGGHLPVCVGERDSPRLLDALAAVEEVGACDVDAPLLGEAWSLRSVLDFMCHGEVGVAQVELDSFLAVAEELRVGGLTQSQPSTILVF